MTRQLKSIASIALAAVVGGGVQSLATTPPATPQGAITVKIFQDGTAINNTIASLTNHASFPDSPAILEYSPRFEWPTTVDGTAPPGNSPVNGSFPWDNYGVQILGYFYPPTTGNYTFAIASDDNGRLYLSTDADPAKKVLIAQEPDWNGVRAFENPEGVDRRRTVADAATGRSVNVSAPVALVANRPYYIEAIMSEGSGGDSLAVTYTTDGSFPLDQAEPIPGSQLRTIDKADGPLALGTGPASQTIAAGSSVNFTVGVPSGTPPYYYEWLRDGNPITDVDGNAVTGHSYSIPRVELTDNNAKFSVRISNAAGQTVTTPDATLTVTTDTTAPTMTKVIGGDSFNTVTITYSEPMGTAAGTASNYTLSGGITISGAEFVIFNQDDPADLANTQVVRLTTSTQPQGTNLTLTVSANVRDLANNSVNPNTASFRTFQLQTGLLLYKRWDTVNNINTLRADPGLYPDNPTLVETRSIAETGSSDPNQENFVAQLKGFFIPPTTGDYVFFVSSDDNCMLFLSTDENPANLHLIAADIGWQNNRTWTGAGTDDVKRRGDLAGAGPFENRSDEAYTSQRFQNATGLNPEDTANPWPTVDANGNAKITLTAGNRYALEFFHSEGTSGDRAEFTYKLASEADPANGSESIITGNMIAAVVEPSSFPPTITQAPTNSYVFNKGDTLTFNVVADGSSGLTYQWYKNKKAIAGATNSTLVVSNAGVTEVGDYSVDVRNANGVTTTRNATDDPARALMKGAFVVEAEDFNYGGGQTVAGASTMPLSTNLFGTLDGTPGIDFKLITQSTTDSAANGNAYRNGYVANGATVEFPTTAADQLGNVDIAEDTGNTNHRNRGDFVLTNNYKIGWGATGNWFQYTRNFPAGDYNAVLAYSDGNGTAPNSVGFALDLVTGNPAQANPAITAVGTAQGDQTGGWSANDFAPLRKADGSLATYSLGPNTTVRLTITQGTSDLDYILFYPIGGGGEGPQITVSRNATGAPVITFEGVLESATSITGQWAPVAGATSPYTAPTSDSARFFRSRSP